MISILIPTYNYIVFPLVKNLHQQIENIGIPFEITVMDDASTHSESILENEKINKLSNCELIPLKENIGRSKIRNHLAEHAKFDWLLFLDADTMPTSEKFLQTYLDAFNSGESVIYGGVHYSENFPRSCSLRHRYGLQREAVPVDVRKKNPHHAFITMAFAIKKTVFDKVKFNEKLDGYGYEDSVFAHKLQQQSISILHIDNPVTHRNLETNEVFIQKSHLALKNLLKFHEEGQLNDDNVTILNLYLRLKKYRFLFLIRGFFKVFRNMLKKNLASSHPSLFYFDVYRLGYLSSIKK